LSRQVTRRNMGTKLDSSLLNIKAQLESSSGPGSPQVSEPTSPQMQHQQQHAQQQMFYEKEIDDNLLLFCKESLDVVIQGSGNVVYDDMSQINQLFKFDTGRRLFAFLLQYFANRKEQQLQAEGFEVLLFLYNSCLNELAASDTNDWNTLSILMDTSALFYQRSVLDAGRKEFMRDILKTHFIWQNADYWESNFWPSFTAEYRATFGGDNAAVDPSKARQFIQSKMQREWVQEHLRAFCLNMIFWGMTKDNCRVFVQNISNCTSKHRGFFSFYSVPKFSSPIFLLCMVALLCFEISHENEFKELDLVFDWAWPYCPRFAQFSLCHTLSEL
jgi:hypothetical protein